MKKILYSLAFASMLLCSCGGGSSSSSNTEEAPKEHILKAAQTEIKGDLKGCYELVDKNYKVKFAKKSYESDVVTVELKRTSKDLPYDRKNVVIFPEGKESSAEFCAGFGIEILDENGDVIEKQNANSNPYSWDEMTAALQLLEDETTTIAFHMEDLSKAVSFRILSIVQPNEERKTAMGSLVDAAKSAAEISDADVEDAEKAMKVAGEAMDAATKMLDALGGLK
ncbi:MAG: hypothetical protein J6B15_04990 [Muribaculaceae bacterium]|nr:hypothetical protein [Muribaculaceae bacterium]